MTTPARICWNADCTQEPEVLWRRRAELGGDDVLAVLACRQHAITLDAAAHVHQPTCQLDVAMLPACGCSPEPLPPTAPTSPDVVTLPTGWSVPAV